LPAASSTDFDAVGAVCADCWVSVVAPATSLCTTTTSVAPSAAPLTFCEISLVAAVCSSTDAAAADVYSTISPIRWAIRPIAATALPVEFCTSRIWLEISSVALAVATASDLTSAATTAEQRPTSPARAASMVALSASRFVCSAMPRMSFTTSPIFYAANASASMSRLVACGCPRACRSSRRPSSDDS
jgi:hypothetical protein